MDFTGLDSFMDAAAFSRVRVINGVNEKAGITNEVFRAHRGKFLIGGVPYERVMAVLLAFRRTSQYFEGKYPKSVLTCFSNNYFEPAATQAVSPKCRIVQNGRVVGVCPKAISNECRESVDISMLLVEPDCGSDVHSLTLRGMNLYSGAPFRKLLGHLRVTDTKPYANVYTLRNVAGNEVFPDKTMADKAMLTVFDNPVRVEKEHIGRFEEIARQLWEHNNGKGSFSNGDQSCETPF